MISHPLWLALALGYLLGCVSILLMKEIPAWYVIPSIAFPLLTLCYHLRQPILVVLIFAWAAGLQHSLWVCSQTLQIPPQLFGHEHTIKGSVVSAPTSFGDYIKFDVELTSFCDKVSHCHEFSGIVRLYGRSRVAAGDNVVVKAQLRKPAALYNPGQASKLKPLFLKGIIAQGRVTHVISQSKARPTIRQRIASRIEHKVSGPMRGIIKALVVGYQDEISQTQWAIFRHTGTSHLIAISGLHVGMIAGGCYLLVKLIVGILRRSDSFICQPFACIASCMAALSYSALAGFSIPTTRACIMICVVMLCQCSPRVIPKVHVLALACVCVLVANPLSVHHAGFWLSFVAVAWLLLFANAANKKWIGVQLKLSLGLVPVTLIWFSQASLISPVTNLFAIPWMSFLVVPWVLFASIIPIPLIDSFCFGVAKLNLAVLMAVLAWFDQPWAYFSKAITASQACVLLLGCLLLLLPVHKKKWGLVCLAAAWVPLAYRPDFGQFSVSFLDIGQGTSVVVKTHDHLMVYDFGPKIGSFDAGAEVLVPYLSYLGANKIDLAIVSHADLDHFGGFASVAAAFPIKQTMSSNLAQFSAQKACRQGDSWVWDGVLFEVLHPAELMQSKNNQSCVLKVSNQRFSVLLTGDIEREAEQSLLRYGVQADVLMVPHHGSKSSSSQAFIERVNPKYAIISAGRYNPYHLPHQSIIDRYVTHGIAVLQTKDTGMIQFVSSSNQPQIWKPKLRRIWDGLAN